MCSYFINHSKHAIAVTDKKASENISLFMSSCIKDNGWSITDSIEFIDYFKSSSELNQKITKLVEENYYYCDPVVHQSFYNY